MSAADPNVLYSGTGQDCAGAAATIAPMYKSADGGHSWIELPAGLGLKPLLIDPANPNNVFAADCSALYLSTDGGMTWLPKPASEADNIWQTYPPVAMDSGSLVGGDTAPETTPHWDHLYAVGNDAQNVGLVGFSGERGNSWANITSSTEALSGASAVVASIDEGGKLWVVDRHGVWSTTDYGVNWTLSNSGLEYLVRSGAAFNDVEIGQDGSVYLATNYGMFVQRAPGEAWWRPDNMRFGHENMLSLLLTRSSPRRLWINAEDHNGDPIVFVLSID
jgi:photosystem II stability/assembly factor-like uncharacterized protein